MKTLFERSRGLDPDASAELLGATDITKSHNVASLTGQSDPDGPLHSHFLAFVNHRGHLVELDGYSHAIPRTHGPIQGDLLHVCDLRIPMKRIVR
jgi:Ubiquitin carboxyl-terminal hydrolase, family 1